MQRALAEHGEAMEIRMAPGAFDFDEAVRRIDRALRYSPGQAIFYANLGTALEGAGKDGRDAVAHCRLVHQELRLRAMAEFADAAEFEVALRGRIIHRGWSFNLTATNLAYYDITSP